MEKIINDLKEELKRLDKLKQSQQNREVIKVIESQQERVKEQITEIERDLFILCNA